MKGGAQVGSNARPPTKSAFSTTVAIPCLPEGVTTDQKKAFMVGLMAAGTSTSKSIAAWKVYIMTYTLILFPETFALLPKNSFTKAPVTQDHVDQYIKLYNTVSTLDTSSSQAAIDPSEVSFNNMEVFPGIPLAHPGHLARFFHFEASPKVIAAHYSLVLFIMGKRLEGSDHGQLTTNRPSAVIRKAHLNKLTHFLNGKYRLSDTSHLYMNSAWAEMSAFK